MSLDDERDNPIDALPGPAQGPDALPVPPPDDVGASSVPDDATTPSVAASAADAVDIRTREDTPADATLTTIARSLLYALIPRLPEDEPAEPAEVAAGLLVVDLGLPFEAARGVMLDLFQGWNRPGLDQESIDRGLAVAAETVRRTPRLVGRLRQAIERKESARAQDAAKLVTTIVVESNLFMAEDGRPYAAIRVGDHVEIHDLRSEPFGHLVRGIAYEATGGVPGDNALQSALAVLEVRARRGPVCPVWTRFGLDSGDGALRLYLDLCDPLWRQVEVDAEGYRTLSESSVCMRRPSGLLPIPEPVPGGRLEELWGYLNVSEAQRPLVLGWLIGAMNPAISCPILAIHGEQGSAKTTTSSLLRRLIDPHHSELRCPPGEERDLMIAALNSGVLAFDNVSHIPDWLSDGLCRVTTGGSMSRRANYTDADEIHLRVRRPTLLNGIEDLATRHDLLDRCILLHLERIDPGRRQFEQELRRDFEEARPRLLGVLLDLLSGALRLHPEVELVNRPRMADFARFAEAGCRAAGYPAGAFLEAYETNREQASRIGLEGSPVAMAVLGFIRSQPQERWQGTATELLEVLNRRVDEATRRSGAWPKAGNRLSNALRRNADGLRRLGVDVETGLRRGADGNRTIIIRTLRPPAPGGSDAPTMATIARPTAVPIVGDTA